MPRDRFLRQSLGVLHNDIKKSRILVVGAGGIGCELLKNLVATGFGEIHIVDLDTIDLSNLNRQFLFRQQHIKQSKALVAKEVAGKFNPAVKIEAYHENIKDARFNTQWYKSFALVFNALDNLDARRHVNRMCIATDVPLIESGTTGWLGQVQPIKPGHTQCYDCTPKETPKTFPVCTIRSTPSQPIHCIVWAKSYLFTELFGTSEEDANDVDHSEDSANKEEIETLRQEAAALKNIRSKIGTADFQRAVFEKVFCNDIKRLRSMEDMWKSRKPPEPLDYEDLKLKAAACPPTVLEEQHREWNLVENVNVFTSSLVRLTTRIRDVTNGATHFPLAFDKDDQDALDFVASAANLRSIIFGIPAKSLFEIKQMAGNIIPAIATTNATTAALCVLQAFKVMQDNFEKAKMVFLAKSVDRAIGVESLRPPNPECAVCGNARATLAVDLQSATLSDVVEGVLKAKLGYTDEMSISTDAGVIYDPDEQENLPRTLLDLGITKDSFITVIDDSDENTKVNLVLAIVEADESLPNMSLTPDTIAISLKAKPTNGVAAPQTNGTVDAATPGTKRKRDADDDLMELDSARKREKLAVIGNEKPISLDDADGAIVLD